jgi:lysophospholipase L1-like esterase
MTWSSSIAGAVAGLVLATAVTTSTPAASEAATQCATAQAPTRILLYGDSLTHSFSADWTWRYRLWQSLIEADASFDFVGPRTDVAEFTTKRLNSWQYRNAQFDRDHAALRGMKFLSGYYQLNQLAQDYVPDVVVASIGANDLLTGASLDDLRTHWREQIGQARTHAPGVDFVLVPLPQIWFNQFTDYNTMLGEVAAEMDTTDERVVVAPMAQFDRRVDTIDNAHPSTSGELKVASVVARALADVGIGNGQLASTPDLPDNYAWAPAPIATVEGTTITVTWPAVTYASSMNVWARNRATGATGVKRYVTGTTTDLTGTAGRSYDVWLAPVQGFMPTGTTSKPIQVLIPAPEPTPTPEPTATPTPDPSPTAEPSPSPTPEPTTSPTPDPSPTAEPSPSPSP